MSTRRLRAMALGAGLGAGLGLVAIPAVASVCEIDDVPAATLLLPYFEVDLARPSGATTLFSISNAGPAMQLVNVTLWTDLGVPTVAFPVYLTGFDIETLNLRDVFAGNIPASASVGQDPADTISPQGPWSQDLNLPGCTGHLPVPQFPPAVVDSLRRAHSGQAAPLLGGCAGSVGHPEIARGYVTVDVVHGCSDSVHFPSDPGYFGPGGRASSANVLAGDFFFVDPSENSARGSNLVRIEAAPGRFRPGDKTFYGRFRHGGLSNYQAIDDREPLAYTWATRYLQGGGFDGGTSFIAWRDPGQASAVVACGNPQPWIGLDTTLAFDEEEQVYLPDPCPILCPPSQQKPNFPAVAQRVDVTEVGLVAGFPGGPPIPIPFDFGWLAIQLDSGASGLAPSWFGAEMSASGRFSVSATATPLDSACGPAAQLPGF